MIQPPVDESNESDGSRVREHGRPPNQTRHTYACWSLAAGGNLAFVAAQMGPADYLTFMKIYGRWIKPAYSSELQRTWAAKHILGESGTNFCPKKPKQKA